VESVSDENQKPTFFMLKRCGFLIYHTFVDFAIGVFPKQNGIAVKKLFCGRELFMEII
jgi:hypothetical protein